MAAEISTKLAKSAVIEARAFSAVLVMDIAYLPLCDRSGPSGGHAKEIAERVPNSQSRRKLRKTHIGLVNVSLTSSNK